MIDEVTGTDFLNELRQLIRYEVMAQLNNVNFERYLDVAVQGYNKDTNSCSCVDTATNEIYDDVINYSGSELSQGNIVRMYISGNDKYIGRHLTDKEA